MGIIQESTSSLSDTITLRPAEESDRDFLLDVFASTRELELAALEPSLARQFVEMQFMAQQQGYKACYPAAENSIILASAQPIGRILVHRSDQAILLVDISLLPVYRRHGIGSLLIRGLLDEAKAAGRAVRLSVYQTNPAMRLYERLGFSKVGEEGIYFHMECRPVR